MKISRILIVSLVIVGLLALYSFVTIASRASHPPLHAAGIGPEMELSDFKAYPPISPTLSAVALSGAVQLKWDATFPEWARVAYHVYRKSGWFGSYKMIISTPGSTYTDNGLRQGQTYSYYVTVVNGEAESSPSPTIEAVPK
jgi:hypothetical protein